ncbi:MAG: hypothetical protein ACOX1P_00670 [Thermoguttaceae bacterium]
MSSNFFEQQDVARRNTGVLVLLFLTAVAMIVLAVYAIFALVFVNLSEHGERSPTSRRLPWPGSGTRNSSSG